MDTFLIITSDELVSSTKKLWGDGSWIAPRNREALEWFMLARIMGWNVRIISNTEIYSDPAGKDLIKWLIIACDPEQLSVETENWLFQIMSSTSILAVVRSGNSNTEWLKSLGINFSERIITGKKIRWFAHDDKNAQIKQLSSNLQSKELETTSNLEPLLLLNNFVVIGQSQYKKGKIISLGFHPIEAMDENAQMKVIIKHLLTQHSPSSIAWLDWKNTMALRMDDPGSSELVHHNIYKDCVKLNKNQWEELGLELKKHRAQLSIGYVNGWVDDADESRGRLRVNGKFIKRKAGKIYPSQEIVYESENNGIYDFQDEYESIRRLKDKGLAQVEAHGFTHIFPDSERWLKASTRYNDKRWFREFGKDAIEYIKSNSSDDHPLLKTKIALAKYWKDEPSVLIFPGEEFTNSAQEDALRFGWDMISSYYQAIKINGRFCWTQYICSPYLDQHHSKWLDSEMPFIGYFHDFDLSRKEIRWFSDCIERWKSLGARNFIDLRTLLVGLNFNLSLKEDEGPLRLDLQNAIIVSSDYKYPIKIKTNKEKIPDELVVQFGDDINIMDCKSEEKINIDENGAISLTFTIHKNSN